MLNIESSCSTRPLATFIWTAAMGCWCGVMYALIGRGMAHGNPFRQAVTFGGLVFGVNWLIFNLFALLFIRTPVLDLVYRSVFDSLAVMLGIYISSFFSGKQEAPDELKC